MTETSPARVGGNSVVMYRVGGRDYPMKTVRNCRVCMSPYRFDVEEGLVAGRVYRKIVESLPEDCDLTSRNLMDHYNNGHLPLEQAGYRRIVEARAESLGKSVESGIESLIDGVTLSQLVVQKTFESLVAGEIGVELKDGLAAAKFLADMGEFDEGGTDMAAVSDAFMVYHEHAQQHMSAEEFERFGRALKVNPVLRALAARYDGEVVEGEAEDVTGRDPD